MADTPIDYKALYQAVRHDDVATVEAILLAREDIHELIRSINRKLEIRVKAAGQMPFADRSFRPFFLFCPRHVRHHSTLFVGEAAHYDSLDVLAWFFASERVELLGASLAVVMPRIVKHATSTAALEILLTSQVFRDRVSETKKQEIMHQALVSTTNRDVVAQLVAHGLELSPALVLDFTTRSFFDGWIQILDAIVGHGGTVVGADLVMKRNPRLPMPYTFKSVEFTQRLLELGTDAGTCLGEELRRAARRNNLDIVRLLLAHGFADVDARDSDGSTALEKTAIESQSFELSVVLPVVRVLMAYGATYAHIIAENLDSVRENVKVSIQMVLNEERVAACSTLGDYI